MLGLRLDSMILRVFSNLNHSMNLPQNQKGSHHLAPVLLLLRRHLQRRQEARRCCECLFHSVFPHLLHCREAYKGNPLVRQEITVAALLCKGLCPCSKSVCRWHPYAGRHFHWSFTIRLCNLKDVRENWHRLLLNPFPRTKLPLQPTRVTWYQMMERANTTSVLGISVEQGFQKGPMYTCPRQRGPRQKQLSV